MSFFPEPVGIPFQFGLTAPRQSMALARKLANNSGERKKIIHKHFMLKF
jgi:hypothetical protein